MGPINIGRTHRILIGLVAAGALVIAAIGFAGSYAAVRDLAERKGFGGFAPFFPIGIDAGIVVLLALDLLLTWTRIPFPLLRQTAWLLTAATIAFNGAAAWPDPLGVGMHAVIPVLFVVAVEAARHAVGRMADITADRHMEGVRIARWLLAFPSTFLLWRRMKLWELRSYDQVIRMEQDRLVYEARLRAHYGRNWKRRAPVETMMPLKLARYGIPLADTAPDAVRTRPATDNATPDTSPELERSPTTAEPQDAVQHEFPFQPDEQPTRGTPDAPTPHPSAAPEPPRTGVSPGALEQPAAAPAAQSPGPRSAPRSAVRTRIPTQQQHLPSEPGPGESAPHTEPTPGEPPLKGKPGLERLYWSLPETERDMSANALAPLLAPHIGLSEGTTRKYLGHIIRAGQPDAEVDAVFGSPR